MRRLKDVLIMWYACGHLFMIAGKKTFIWAEKTDKRKFTKECIFKKKILVYCLPSVCECIIKAV